jgi:8-oxo-dGTP pyrophosphatase MutT (NUDIX family)
MTNKPNKQGDDAKPKKPENREDPPDLELDKRRFNPAKPIAKPIQGFRNFVTKRRPIIEEVVRETTSGGIVFRRNADKQVEILLIQDAKGRWTIPKGHVEPDEETKYTAQREITEETGLQEMKVGSYLGKVNFRYRRAHTLVLMTMHIYLVEAQGDTDKLQGEDWLMDMKWLAANDAVDKIAYEDIGKLILVGMKRVREGKL